MATRGRRKNQDNLTRSKIAQQTFQDISNRSGLKPEKLETHFNIGCGKGRMWNKYLKSEAPVGMHRLEHVRRIATKENWLSHNFKQRLPRFEMKCLEKFKDPIQLTKFFIQLCATRAERHFVANLSHELTRLKESFPNDPETLQLPELILDILRYGLPENEIALFEELFSSDLQKPPPDGFSSWTAWEDNLCRAEKKSHLRHIANMSTAARAIVALETPAHAVFLAATFNDGQDSLPRFHALLQEMKWLDSYLTNQATLVEHFRPF